VGNGCRCYRIKHLFYNAGINLNHWNTVNFILDNLFLVGLVVLSGGALLLPALLPKGKRASSLEVTQLINRGKTVILDVRETAEFAAGHLRDAKHIPLGELASRIGELDKQKAKSIIIVCQTGARADKAARILAAGGFEDVVTLDGGQAAWVAGGLPTTK
jgi:rhodanese-related sulfurtransferase